MYYLSYMIKCILYIKVKLSVIEHAFFRKKYTKKLFLSKNDYYFELYLQKIEIGQAIS